MDVDYLLALLETRGAEDRIRALGGDGILTPADLKILSGQRKKVFALMLDGRWHLAPDIVAAAGGSEGLRRMRELRNLSGYSVLRMRVAHRRCWAYKLVRSMGAKDD
jgi:hypothetical protein